MALAITEGVPKSHMCGSGKHDRGNPISNLCPLCNAWIVCCDAKIYIADHVIENNI